MSAGADPRFARLRAWLTAALLVSTAGCAPTLPFHLTETAEVLKKQQVAVQIAGGGGDGTSTNSKLTVDRCCGGGALRARFGLGGRHELGGEVGVIGATGKGGPILPTGKLRYKLGLGEHLALVTGVGVAARIDTSGGSGNAVYVGGDAALVASTRALAQRFTLYGGLRFTFSLPAESRFYENTPTEGFIIPGGVAIRASDRFVFFFEGGLTGGFSEPNSSDYYGWIGGYGAFAIEYASP